MFIAIVDRNSHIRITYTLCGDLPDKWILRAVWPVLDVIFLVTKMEDAVVLFVRGFFMVVQLSQVCYILCGDCGLPLSAPFYCNIDSERLTVNVGWLWSVLAGLRCEVPAACRCRFPDVRNLRPAIAGSSDVRCQRHVVSAPPMWGTCGLPLPASPWQVPGACRCRCETIFWPPRYFDPGVKIS